MNKTTISYWTEKLETRLPPVLVAPDRKYHALQAPDGRLLQFSLGSDGALYLAREQPGGTWAVNDLGAAQLRKDCAGQAEAHVHAFAASPGARPGTVTLAMALRAKDSDYLYLSTDNSLDNLSWVQAPSWTRYPNEDLANFRLADVGIFVTADQSLAIVADIAQDVDQGIQEIRRYRIAPDKREGRYWHPLALPATVAAEGYASCVGRGLKGYVDGLYTFGRNRGSTQFLFCPLENAFGDGPPLPTLLGLPGGTVPTAMASLRNGDMSTDLFAIGGSALYYFSSASQAAGPGTGQSKNVLGIALLENALFVGTTELTVVRHDGLISVLGRNGSDEIFCTSVPQASVASAAAWRAPQVVVKGIERMSPLLNGASGGTLYGTGAGVLHTVSYSASSERWQASALNLPKPPSDMAAALSHFRTTIGLTGEDNAAVKNGVFRLSASHRCAAYINGLYYRLDAAAVHIAADDQGFAAILELPGLPAGTTFTVATDTDSVTFDPHEAENIFTVCFSGTACTRDEGERTRSTSGAYDYSDVRIYAKETGYIPVRLHKEISGTLEAVKPSVTVRGVGENDWQTPRDDSEALKFDGPLKAPDDLLKYVRSYSGGDQRSRMTQLDGWSGVALALHGANLAAASGAKQVNFIGHSRGAASAIMAAWFIYAYGPRDIRISIFAIDPVPGTGKWYGTLTQLPPNVANYVGIYAWDMCVQPGDLPFQAVVPRPNRKMAGLPNSDDAGQLGSSWDTLADGYQQNDPLAKANARQPENYALYACRGRHSTVAGNTTADSQYDPNNASAEVAPVPQLVYRLARAYLTKWGTIFQSPSAVGDSVWELRRRIHLDHAKLDAMGGGATRTSMIADRPYVRRVSSISGRNPADNYFMDNVVGDPPIRLAYPVTAERKDAGWVQWKFL